MAELKIDLELPLDELVDVEVAPDAVLGEGGLQKLIIGNVLEAGLAGPIDPRNGDALREDALAQLTGDGTGAGLFDFGKVHVEGVVEEGKELVLGDKVGRVHYSNARIGSRSHGCAFTLRFCSVSTIKMNVQMAEMAERGLQSSEIVQFANCKILRTGSNCDVA